MKNKKSTLTVLIALVVLSLILVSPVHAKDIMLKPILGSDCDPRTFEYRGHTVTEGFAVSITADLPFDRETQIKFGCAVAGLSAPWEERGWGYAHEYNPYVKEMWIEVRGDDLYSAWEDSITDNTGTGEASFEAVLEGIGFVFTAYEIYNWLKEVYQTPPVAEWKEGPHWSKAISRQGHWVNLPPTFVPYLAEDEPHLQTACANVLGYFTEGGSDILNITAGAEIYVQWHDIINGGVVQTYIGTYSVSFEVSLNPLCAMKTKTDGYFYVPNVAIDLLKIEMLFDNANLTGDQTGGASPYPAIANYPDGKVSGMDVSFVSSKFGSWEGETSPIVWDYMADVNPDRRITGFDVALVSQNFGKSGTYITDLAGVAITFNTGQTVSPESDGFVTIPPGATSFNVTRYGTLIGAMVVFW